MDKSIAAIPSSSTGSAHATICALATLAGVGHSIVALLRTVAATGTLTASPTGLQVVIDCQARVVEAQ